MMYLLLMGFKALEKNIHCQKGFKVINDILQNLFIVLIEKI
jgi:hypothetical protein